MDEHLKQRLVGALVLLSAAVIFLPLVFDGRDGDESYQEMLIPDEPVVTLDVTEPAIDKEHFQAVQQAIESQREASAKSERESSPPGDEGVAPTPPPVDAAEPVVGDNDAVRKAEEAAAREDFAAIKAATNVPASGTDRLSETYTIQLAAFSSKDNAEKLHKQLIEKNYNAYIEHSATNGKTLYRVLVGPQLRKHRAEVIAGALEKEFRLRGIVIRYVP